MRPSECPSGAGSSLLAAAADEGSNNMHSVDIPGYGDL